MQDAAAEVDNLRGLYREEVDQRSALEEALENLRRDYEAKLNATAFDLRSWVGRSQKKEAQARAAEAEKARAAQERAAQLAAEAEAARAAEVRSAAALREVETSLVHADAARVARRIQMRLLGWDSALSVDGLPMVSLPAHECIVSLEIERDERLWLRTVRSIGRCL